MSLGTLAVGIVIFAIVSSLLGWAISRLINDIDFSGVALLIILMVCVYCAISGTYFLYAAGKI